MKKCPITGREDRSATLEASEISLSTRRCVAPGVQLRFTRFWIWLPRDTDRVPVCLCLGQTGWNGKGSVGANMSMRGLKGIANCEPAIEIRRRDFGIECIKILQYKSNNTYFRFKWSELRGDAAAIVYAVPWFDCRFILNRPPLRSCGNRATRFTCRLPIGHWLVLPRWSLRH